jgi:iron complex transport system substrate-binding protein
MARGIPLATRLALQLALAALGALPWLGLSADPAQADTDTVVIDDRGREVHVTAPPERIISLAPHLTELLFAVGAGERIIATVEHADHPAEARSLPRIGSALQLDLERIVALRPQLVIAWASGNPRAQMERLEALGLSVYYSEPTDFAGIARDLRRLGQITGTTESAEAAAAAFEREIDALRARHSGRAPVTVFYQVWDPPLMTVNDQHLIGEALRLCGGVNVFGDLEARVPRPGREAVLAADPEVIVTGGPGEDRADWLEPWRAWSGLTAVQRDNLFFIPPSLIQRPTPRIARGTRLLCAALEQARLRRPEPEP